MHLRCLMNRRHRRIRIVVFVAVLSVGYVGIIFPSVIWNSYTSDLEDIHESHSVRTLLATDDNSTGFQYPTDAFSLDQRANGAIVLHIIGVIYMFVALAIVCDEYFVPSLSVIIERLNISEDVAGATFMAAGGSAPELFTSLIGVFLARNNVGIGTIVGSAVFNILFVIGMCAIVSKTVLDLTWWPLFRDVTFYSISLILLIVFFEDELIEWPEALGLFICYIVYVIFMKFNEKIEGFVKRRIVRRKSRIHSNGNLLNDDINARRRPTRSCSIPILHSGTNHFRHGVLQLMIHTIDPISEGKVHEKAIKLRAVANLVMDSNPSSPVQNGLLRNGDLHNGMPPDQEDRRNGNIPDKNSKLNGNFPDKNRNKQIQIHAISNGHIPRDSPVPMDASHADQTPGNRFIYRTWPTDEESGVASPAALELRVLNRSSNTTEETSLDSSQQTTMTSTRAGMESTDSGDMLTSRSRTEMPKEQDEPLDMSWPSTWRRRVTYVLVAPLIIPMWLTLPDTRRPEKRKWYIVTFVGSIIWIAAFSYLMVWWANTAGETIGIPNEVMGLTVLAAGTSIPDLITSVIVAKKGYGDMAVSSSVGSNIFDITVGLPVPWLLYSAIYGGSSINVDSHGLMCSIVMLFAMLLTVVITIAVSKWKMTKTMGGAMLVLYCAFVVLSVLLELQVVNCPINS